jgi:hypothetical protein
MRGIPGARLIRADGRLLVKDLLSDASIELRIDDKNDPPMPSQAEQGHTTADLLLAKVRPFEREARAQRESSSNYSLGRPARPEVFAARDLLFSRILRRPGILNLCSSEDHGVVNNYSHGGNLVLEWCCGMTHQQVREKFDPTGLTHELASWADLFEEWVGSQSTVEIMVDGPHPVSLLTLRSGQSCPDQEIFERAMESITQWYR